MDFVLIDIEEDKQVPMLLGIPFLDTGATLIDVKKGELTLRLGDEKVHFNLNQCLKRSDFDNAECKIVEQVVPINSELKYGCKIQSSKNENEKNFQYIEDLEVEFLNSRFELKETVLSLNENSKEKPSSSEKKGQEVEMFFEGLILKELPKHMKSCHMSTLIWIKFFPEATHSVSVQVQILSCELNSSNFPNSEIFVNNLVLRSH